MQLLKRRWVRAAALSLAGCALLATFARDAAARDTFPAVLKEKMQMPCVPSCLPCHKAVPGTRANLREDGLRLALYNVDDKLPNDGELATALDAILSGAAAPPGDSDGDKTPDLEELAAGDNPYGGAPLCVGEGPQYGCGASVAPSAPTRFGALAFALAFTGALLRRRRRTA
jgi:MYXO-CTERM domain-containing protein